MSKRVVIELTNRCNLACGHCFSGRHGGATDLPLDLLQSVLKDARAHGFDDISYTGGDPTVHPQFPEVLRLTSEAEYEYSFVTNGWNFTTIFPRIAAYRDNLSIITFSMDGASEKTHDELRGENSYRRLMQAIALCFVEKLPFSISMTITRQNRHELADMAKVASNLGAKGVRYGHLMPNFRTALKGADLSPAERKNTDAEIHEIRRNSKIAIGMAPGHHTTDLTPCGPLNLEEINIDVSGNLTKCCHLSSHGEGISRDDVIGQLRDRSFGELYCELVEDNRRFMEFKRKRLSEGKMQDTDFFPCWVCSLYYGKVDWLKKASGPWSKEAQNSSVDSKSETAAITFTGV